ncbi:hypothetical protein HB662_17320 [Roseomonas frigidaquae]|uniref:Uncharacterized protein n=1 Tax=Falsiroseomonas frigidaquae TaxID=487318 RepID=A0ABX1F2H7_9PROT|nr:hypothetical protein [Falsiroseomonas frigidaquae]NKE46545.1 hypothetical protein [Falsiroseomonas frigidaquae]
MTGAPQIAGDRPPDAKVVPPVPDTVYEPIPQDGTGPPGDMESAEAGARIAAYLADCTDFARAAFAEAPVAATGGTSDPVEAILGVLLGHEFNHQSKGRLAHLRPGLRQRLAAHVARAAPIPFFMSYNGGYHATTRPDFSRPLGFEAGIAELLFLHMIARLKRRLGAVYPPGMVYHIVLNNGVAQWVNDIPTARTEAYARALEAMAAALGAAGQVRLLVQSHLGDFAARMREVPAPPAAAVDAATHHNIERFLGRPCSAAEAGLRLARYAPAEAAWWQELRGLVDAAGGIRLLQVASQDFLSFRPFPGAATRAQTGQVGFRLQGGRPVPVLITTASFARAAVVPVPVRWPAGLALPEAAAG